MVKYGQKSCITLGPGGAGLGRSAPASSGGRAAVHLNLLPLKVLKHFLFRHQVTIKIMSIEQHILDTNAEKQLSYTVTDV
jgi:hypothetical protein